MDFLSTGKHPVDITIVDGNRLSVARKAFIRGLEMQAWKEIVFVKHPEILRSIEKRIPNWETVSVLIPLHEKGAIVDGWAFARYADSLSLFNNAANIRTEWFKRILEKDESGKYKLDESDIGKALRLFDS